MPTISGRTSIATGGAVANVLLGSQYEMAPYDAEIAIAITADKNLVTCFIASGPDILAEPLSLVPVASAIDVPPKYPDDYHWSDLVAEGDRLKIGLSNGNAGTTVVNWFLRITPA
jgi:hypothetical protein